MDKDCSWCGAPSDWRYADKAEDAPKPILKRLRDWIVREVPVGTESATYWVLEIDRALESAPDDQWVMMPADPTPAILEKMEDALYTHARVKDVYLSVVHAVSSEPFA